MSSNSSQKTPKWYLVSHIVLLCIQVILVGYLYSTANTISSQNAEIQKTLYLFEPRINGYSKIIWLRGHDYYTSYETNAEVQIFISSPQAGEFNLTIKNFDPYEPNVDMNYSENRFYMQENIRDITYPTAYKFEGSVPLSAWVKPNSSVGTAGALYVGKLEFQINYVDVHSNIYSKNFTTPVYFELVS